MKRHYADIAEGQMHYRTDGDGEPVLLIHQTRMSSEEYAEVGPLLARERRVVAVDLLGHGYSDTPPAGFTIEDHARSIIQFFNVVGIGKASIVGHHVGSRIAAEVAARWPDRVDRLVLSGCPWYSAEERRALPGDPKYTHIHVAEDGAFLADLWERNRAAFYSPASPELLCKVMAVSLLSLASSYNIHDAVFGHDIDRPLRLIGAPTLIVSGSKDVFYGKLQTVARLIPGSETRVIPDAGYFVCLEKPEEFAAAVLTFIGQPVSRPAR